MRIAILGAGHGGCAAAADLALQGHRVSICTRSEPTLRPILDRGGIEVTGARAGFAKVEEATTDLARAVAGAELIMLVVPSVAHAAYARALAPLLRPEQAILLNPGHTGGALHFHHALRGAGFRGRLRLAETVTLTYICRLEGPARVAMYSPTRNLRFAALPGKHLEAMADLVRPLFPDIRPVGSVLETGLMNINAIFHPPGMLLNAGWIEQTGGGFLFYREGITPAVGRVVEAVDGERLEIVRALGLDDTPFVEFFHQAGLTTLEAARSGSVSRACRESEPNKTIRAPGSLDHRYVREDVGCGLVPMTAFARMVGRPTPTMDSLIHLASLIHGCDYAAEGLTLARMGLEGVAARNLADLLYEGPA
jgi:opine dehydrogenase